MLPHETFPGQDVVKLTVVANGDRKKSCSPPWRFIPRQTKSWNGRNLPRPSCLPRNVVLGDPLEGLIEDLSSSMARIRCARRAPSAASPSLRGNGRGIRSCSSGCSVPAEVNWRCAFPSRGNIAYVFRIGIAVDHRRDHEGGVDHLAETELFGEVIGAVEQRGRWRSCLRSAVPCGETACRLQRSG